MQLQHQPKWLRAYFHSTFIRGNFGMGHAPAAPGRIQRASTDMSDRLDLFLNDSLLFVQSKEELVYVGLHVGSTRAALAGVGLLVNARKPIAGTTEAQPLCDIRLPYGEVGGCYWCDGAGCGHKSLGRIFCAKVCLANGHGKIGKDDLQAMDATMFSFSPAVPLELVRATFGMKFCMVGMGALKL